MATLFDKLDLQTFLALVASNRGHFISVNGNYILIDAQACYRDIMVLIEACGFIRLNTVIITRLIRHGWIICLRIYTPRYKEGLDGHLLTKLDKMATRAKNRSSLNCSLKFKNYFTSIEVSNNVQWICFL